MGRRKKEYYDGEFLMVENRVVDMGLSPEAFYVWAWNMSKPDKHKVTNLAHMAEEMGISARKVRSGVKELEDLGLCRCYRPGGFMFFDSEESKEEYEADRDRLIEEAKRKHVMNWG